ncbi:MAG TPA: 2Fe-2S iron-sulfur cluster-binding protein, partial [Clostridia bacterium]|nr:2Fe-2S iron-sulfur cluster-binding protein [Clostridia bacterium]
VECGAVQCGFCTPGMIMSAKALLDKNPAPTETEVRQAIDNNLCRCTGYVKIVEAILLAAERMRSIKNAVIHG